jgi:histidinol-phosphate aminotransferase
MTWDRDPLSFHGDAELSEALVDLAVNVRTAPPPEWLAAPIAASLSGLARYPDPKPAVAAVAARHHRRPEEVLLTAGAAQAFTLVAQGIPARVPVVVHPQFTEPEAALAAAGRSVRRLILAPGNGFRLDPAAVPDDADLVIIGNPTNPTSVYHPASDLVRLARPGRILVVDEAFADTVPGEPESLSGRRDLPGLVVIRSLTKTWGLAGLRIGYVLAEPEVIMALARHQPLWPVSTPALAAAIACASPEAVAAEREIAVRVAEDRRHLVRMLNAIEGLTVAGNPESTFVLVRVPAGERIRELLRSRGYAVRRGGTFPGLDSDWLRISVREPEIIDPFVATLAEVVADVAAESDVAGKSHAAGEGKRS